MQRKGWKIDAISSIRRKNKTNQSSFSTGSNLILRHSLNKEKTFTIIIVYILTKIK
jgi:hypothetical protein